MIYFTTVPRGVHHYLPCVSPVWKASVVHTLVLGIWMSFTLVVQEIMEDFADTYIILVIVKAWAGGGQRYLDSLTTCHYARLCSSALRWKVCITGDSCYPRVASIEAR